MRLHTMTRATVVGLAFLVPGALHGAVIATTGDFALFDSATASYVANAFDDPAPAPIRLWIEQEGFVLPSDLVLDTDMADPTLRYVSSGADAGEVRFLPGGGPVLPAGTRVNVYFGYFDPLVGASAFGSVSFDAPILGIVAQTTWLGRSDFLRVPGAPYPGNPAFGARGWEADEWGQISPDRFTLTVNASGSSPGDQFRIFTSVPLLEPEPIPEPATYLLGFAGLLSLGLVRRIVA